MNVDFIPVDNGVKDFSVVNPKEVVILPAFGASVSEMQLLNDKGCTIVDTTCPWVSKVWNSVEKHKKKNIPQLFTVNINTKKPSLPVLLQVLI